MLALAQKAQHSRFPFLSLPPFFLSFFSVDHEKYPQPSSMGGLRLHPSTSCHEACSPAPSYQPVWMHFFLSAQTWMILKEDSNNNNTFLEVQ